ncbi:hypothetical protein TNIN_87521 [Trichonephila inaurata madagascariensis]|uniref:DUF4817 domain-containing protein n=1 Tax=Trichonephila inaurata madagascariensis TaxID=2747483 RepID=A0A8X6YIH0_9ARAC|nr:hypothetical protein TNIN_87521 [Trichonephila inaurata madagascariensis]
MGDFNTCEKAALRLMYGDANGNSRAALRLYRERFPSRRVPNHQNVSETTSLTQMQQKREESPYPMVLSIKKMRDPIALSSRPMLSH